MAAELLLEPDPLNAPGDREQQLAALRERLRPVTLSVEQGLPVVEAFSTLLPTGLPRGAVVRVTGPAATSVALALAAGASAAGSWLAAVGLPALGWAAAAELGVDPSRALHVRPPESARWGSVVAALVDAVDVVLVAPEHRVSGTEARRLHARARERGSVLIETRPVWPEEPSLTLEVTGAVWAGLGQGWGRLESRRVTLECRGRRGGRARRATMWLPGPEGVVRCSELFRGPW